MGKFHIYTQILLETRCFQEKFTQLEIFFTQPADVMVATNFKSDSTFNRTFCKQVATAFIDTKGAFRRPMTYDEEGGEGGGGGLVQPGGSQVWGHYHQHRCKQQASVGCLRAASRETGR